MSYAYLYSKKKEEKLQDKNERQRDNFSWVEWELIGQVERNSHKIIICAPSFRTISLPTSLENGTSRVSRSAVEESSGRFI